MFLILTRKDDMEQFRKIVTENIDRIIVIKEISFDLINRLIGTMGLCYYIKDVIVHPDYQGKGVGRLLIDELLKYINEHGVSDTHIFVELCAMPDKIPFYEKFGFSANEAQRLRMMYHVEK